MDGACRYAPSAQTLCGPRIPASASAQTAYGRWFALFTVSVSGINRARLSGESVPKPPDSIRLRRRDGFPPKRRRVSTPTQNHPHTIRPCRDDEVPAIHAIINAAAEIYRGVIPSDCWHEPYMAAAELRSEIAAGVGFIGYEVAGVLVAVMGIQPVRDVDLIRHAYVLPEHQGRGAGSALLAYLRAQSRRPILIGTWAAATWAIAFYGRHGFVLVPDSIRPLLLRAYWNISARQLETSVVLEERTRGVSERMSA